MRKRVRAYDCARDKRLRTAPGAERGISRPAGDFRGKAAREQRGGPGGALSRAISQAPALRLASKTTLARSSSERGYSHFCIGSRAL